MAYNESHLTALSHLKKLAEKVKTDYVTKTEFQTLSDKMNEITETGGEPNVIEEIQLNGSRVNPVGKIVNIEIDIPQAVSDLENDEDFQTRAEVDAAIAAKLSSTYRAGGSLDTADATKLAAENEGVVYNISARFDTDSERFVEGLNQSYPAGTNIVVVNEAGTYKFDVLAGFVDLSEYARTEDLPTVPEITKSSSNGSITVGGSDILVYEHPAADAKESGLYKVTVDGTGHVTAAVLVQKSDITGLGIPGSDTTYQDATVTVHGLMSVDDKKKLDGFVIATSEEVSEMLKEVFEEE